MKRRFGLLLLLCVVITACLVFIHIFNGFGKNNTVNNINTVTDNKDENDDSMNQLKTILLALDKGFNIGNSLDSCDWSYFGVSHKAGYQAAIIYNSSPWSVWDTTEYLFFDEGGKVTISWDLSSLRSDKNSYLKDFSVQLINHDSLYEGQSLNCKVVDMSLIGKDGSLIDVSENYPRIHKLTINEGSSSFVCADFSSIKMRTDELYDKKLTISLEISDYYVDIKHNNTELEESWGNEQISEKMIKTLSDDGFNTVRVPITYLNHLQEDGTIDPLFLDRVEQVVDWVLDNGMYCIIDVHHDTGNQGWIRASQRSYSYYKSYVYDIFVQIADRFKDKSDKLIFEGLNEALNDDSKWSKIPWLDLKYMNEWNQLFVDAVRSTGGKNTKRYLLINTYAALPTRECLKAFRMPSDSIDNHILVGIHCYFDENNMDSCFDIIKQYATKYPLVIGEWGFSDKVENRNTLVDRFISCKEKIGIPCIVWDDGGGMGLYNRSDMSRKYPEIIDAIVRK